MHVRRGRCPEALQQQDFLEGQNFMGDRSEALAAKREALLAGGVDMMDPSSVYAEDTVTVGAGTLLLPGTILRGHTSVGAGCTIGPNVMLTDATVEDGCTINTAQVEDSIIRAGCEIGPYTHIRPGCDVGEESKIGAFVQLKNSKLGRGTKMAHLTYVGDSDVGEDCNFGCGTVTCNYDGFQKHRTTIGSHVFVGCNTNFVAPVSVGEGAFIAAGTTVTKDVPPDALAVGRPRLLVRDGWAEVNRTRKGQKKET